MEKKFVVLEKYGKRGEWDATHWQVCETLEEAKEYTSVQRKNSDPSGYYQSLIIRARVFE